MVLRRAHRHAILPTGDWARRVKMRGVSRVAIFIERRQLRAEPRDDSDVSVPCLEACQVLSVVVPPPLARDVGLLEGQPNALIANLQSLGELGLVDGDAAKNPGSGRAGHGWLEFCF